MLKKMMKTKAGCIVITPFGLGITYCFTNRWGHQV